MLHQRDLEVGVGQVVPENLNHHHHRRRDLDPRMGVQVARSRRRPSAVLKSRAARAPRVPLHMGAAAAVQ